MQPLYLKIKDTIQEKIRSGEYAPGDKLPSEKQLCEQFKVSRITVRHALDQLESLKLVTSMPGKGVFVKSGVIRSVLKKVSAFGETLSQMGMEGYTVIRAIENDVMDLGSAAMLIDPEFGQPCKVCLTGYSDGEPVAFYRSILRKPYGMQMCEKARELEADRTAFSTFDLYAALDINIEKLNQRVLAINSDDEISEILKMKKGDAVLVLESILYGESMTPIEYKLGYYRTDKYSFHLDRDIHR